MSATSQSQMLWWVVKYSLMLTVYYCFRIVALLWYITYTHLPPQSKDIKLPNNTQVMTDGQCDSDEATLSLSWMEDDTEYSTSFTFFLSNNTWNAQQIAFTFNLSSFTNPVGEYFHSQLPSLVCVCVYHFIACAVCTAHTPYNCVKTISCTHWHYSRWRYPDLCDQLHQSLLAEFWSQWLLLLWEVQDIHICQLLWGEPGLW